MRDIDKQLQRTREGNYIITDTKTTYGERYLPMTDGVYQCFQKLIKKRKKQKVDPMIDGKAGFLVLDKNGMPYLALHWEKRFEYALGKYKISEGTARDYMRLYRDVNGLPPKNRIQKEENTVKISMGSSQPDLSEYESMTKDELIKELVKSRISEARLKKGYEVKGAGAHRTVTIFDNWNMK